MENKVGHEGAHPSQPSSSATQDSDQQYSRPRKVPDSDQSNYHRRLDDTSAADDDHNSYSRSSSSQENREKLIEQLFLQQIDRQLEEDVLRDTDDSVNDGDETVEEESLVSEEGSNSNSQDDQNQLGTTGDAVLFPDERVGRRQYGFDMLISLNRNVRSTLDVGGMSYEELTELGERIGIVQRGLPKETILRELKTRVHTTSEDSTEEETEICIVCQDRYENKDKIGTLDCKHYYHKDCITQWLVRKNVCPICKRQALKTMEESKKEAEGNEC
ncbi:hypothetical protein MKX03_013379 [Papaver bracteatum]|nr:hypothetical protein MKX03_013379 [Papaver bracteatum]